MISLVYLSVSPEIFQYLIMYSPFQVAATLQCINHSISLAINHNRTT